MLTEHTITKYNVQLQFCDTYDKAYAAVAYLRFINPARNEVFCRLITAKARVAPLKPRSIPRLELQVALIGARLFSCLKEGLKMEFGNFFFGRTLKQFFTGLVRLVEVLKCTLHKDLEKFKS